MTYKTLGVIVGLAAFTFGSETSFGQESINAGGGDAIGSGGSASWSLGQVAYQARIGDDGALIEGVQQPYEVFEVTAIKQAKQTPLLASAYPNPMEHALVLSIEEQDLSGLSYQILDLNGRLLSEDKIRNRTTKVDMGAWATATYLLNVKRDNINIRTFKIIKN